MFLNSWGGPSKIVRVILDGELLLGINQLVLVHYLLETRRSFPLQDNCFRSSSDIIKFMGVVTKQKRCLCFFHFLVIMFLLH
ncbi:hypothetical protein NC652_033977 [Populus alba x Populus x berolinensis]|uniref:Uncharacterized protein n=1 Tax=Populus alba x Populus x berolinensis TaxID=444605 RepID=A0AAD6LUZ6_9ROSI|nr:hypothetical protein NC652_033977 [Populus alba x Populus x berolinensis]KAJ6973677.1 hypothetical protein NC653_033882 [Populus alba x Populus x berolinensis]